MFDDFMTNIVTICKQDGARAEGIKACIQDRIHIDEALNKNMPPIVAGDVIEHKQANGVVEYYEVIDPCYYEDLHIGNHYQCKVQKRSVVKRQQPSIHNIFHVNATQANIATDNAKIAARQILNIEQSNEIEKLFESLLEVVKNNTLENQKAIESAISEMKQAVGKSSFGEKYNAFMQSVANHMTVFMPLMPQLTALLQAAPIC